MKTQQEELRHARKTLDATTAELAELLGVTASTLNSYLRPPTSQAHRQMPKTARLLLERLLKERLAVKRKRAAAK
jgi:transcriptional regulator with XRE-family HTH domain